MDEVMSEPVRRLLAEAGDAWCGRADCAEAERLSRAALADAEGCADAPGRAAAGSALAEFYRGCGRLDEAEPLYLQALALLQQSGSAAGPGFAATLNGLAAL